MSVLGIQCSVGMRAAKDVSPPWPYGVVRWVTAVLLLVAAVGKTASLLSNERILLGMDPVIYWLSRRQLWAMVAILEIGVVLILVRSHRPVLHLWLITWIYTLFLFYRLGLWLFVGATACHCLGLLPQRIGVGLQHIDKVLPYFVIVLLFLTLLALWRYRRCQHLKDQFHPGCLTVGPLATLALLAGYSWYAQAANDVLPTLEVLGRVEYTYFRENVEHQSGTNSFRVLLQPPRYALRFDLGDAADVMVRAKQCTSDGTDCFLFEEINTHYRASEYYAWDGDRLVLRPVSTPVRLQNRASCTIVEGPFPPERDENMAALWVAFASHLFLTNTLRTTAGPALLPGGPWYRQHGIEVPFYWIPHQEPPRFIATCRQIHPGQEFRPDTRWRVLHDKTGLIIRPLSGSLVGGYTNWNYTVIAWTNVDALTVPAEARFECFFVDPQRPTSVTRYSEHTVRVSLARTELLARLEPPATNKLRVVEGRRRLTGFSLPYVYFSENGQVMDRDGLRAFPDYLQEQAMRGGIPPNNRFIELIYYVLLSLALLAPLVVAVVRSGRALVVTYKTKQ